MNALIHVKSRENVLVHFHFPYYIGLPMPRLNAKRRLMPSHSC